MLIPTEPIGSIPRPLELIRSFGQFDSGLIGTAALAEAEAAAVVDTIQRFEATGSPIITDGEQRKPSFLTYPIAGSPNVETGWFNLKFADGHRRNLPQLKSGPLRYRTYAATFLERARAQTRLPLKQAVIAPSALSLLYPVSNPVAGYSREQFLADLLDEAERDIRQCLDAGADSVQIDFTEARFAVKMDPSLRLLDEFIQINNWVLERFSEQDRQRIGIHACAGGDCDTTHSADVDYAYVLPALFQLKAGRFYLQLASEPEPERILSLIEALRGPGQFIFAGVIDSISREIETPELVRDRILLASKYIPVESLGSTDDCGFAPFADDVSTGRDLAFAKIAARVEGSRLARLALS